MIAWIILMWIAPGAWADQDRVAWMAKRLVEHQDISDYERALKRFVSISDPRVLPALLKLADGDQAEARAEAAGVLWHYNNKEVREKLVELTSDPLPTVRLEAAKSLGLMNYSASLKIIIEELDHKEEGIRKRAWRALGETKKEVASKHWTQVTKKARSSLDKVWQAYAGRNLGLEPTDNLAKLRTIILAIPKKARLLRKTDPEQDDLRRAMGLARNGLALRLEAAEALSRLGDEASLAVLVEATGDRASFSHSRGAWALLRRHGDEAAAACAKGLNHDQVLVRLGAAQTAARLKIRHDASRHVLAQALGEATRGGSRLVRQAAMRAIAVQKMKDQSEAVLNALNHSDAHTRMTAANTLGQLGQTHIVKQLLKRLGTENSRVARRGLYQGLTMLRAPGMVRPLFHQLKLLFRESRQNSRAVPEMDLCIKALASTGEPAAKRMLKLLKKAKGKKRDLLLEVLAHTGCESALSYFLDSLRDAPPLPDGPAVRFFDSLGSSYTPRIEALIRSESAMWIRVILARALYRLGKRSYGRGILWGLQTEDPYINKLAAAQAWQLKMPSGIRPLIGLLEADDSRTAWFAARALLSYDSARATNALLRGIGSRSLRRRTKLPLLAFWEGASSAKRPYAKEVDGERIWVLFAEDRLGNPMDLFLTWSEDGRTWREPVFTGLTSFSDPDSQVPPPTFSLKVEGRQITIALTRTFARSANPQNPKFKTLQRLHKHKLKELFRDRDKDGMTDLEEKALWTRVDREDTDGDDLNDGRDANPMARPPRLDRNKEVLQVLAFSTAAMIKQALPKDARRLVVIQKQGRRIPELATFPGLVLHLSKKQADEMWKNTGASYPRVSFGATNIEADKQRASQEMFIERDPANRTEIEIRFAKRGDVWTVIGYRELD